MIYMPRMMGGCMGIRWAVSRIGVTVQVYDRVDHDTNRRVLQPNTWNKVRKETGHHGHSSLGTQGDIP